VYATSGRFEASSTAAMTLRCVYSRLERILVLPWNENYTDEHVRYIGSSIIDAVKKLAR